MKKMIALLIALSLVFAAAALAEEAAEETDKVETTPGKLVGVWYGYSNGVEGYEYRCTGDTRIEFNRDKTGLLLLDGQSFTFTWSIDDDRMAFRTTLDDSSAMEYKPHGWTRSDGALVVEAIQDGATSANGRIRFLMIYVFTKEDYLLRLPEAVAAEEEEALYGSYTAAYAVVGAKTQEVSPDNAVTVRVDFAEAEVTTAYGSKVFVTDLKDGKVTVTDEGFPRMIGLDKTFSTVTLSRTSDENMVVAVAADAEGNVGATFYLTKTE